MTGKTRLKIEILEVFGVSMLEPENSRKSYPTFDSILHDKRSQAATCGPPSSFQSPFPRKTSFGPSLGPQKSTLWRTALEKRSAQAWRAESELIGWRIWDSSYSEDGL